MKSIFLFLCLFFATTSFAASPFTNLEVHKKALGFQKYYSQKNPGRALRIAVLDKGFAGYEKEIGRSLPAKTYYFAGPVPGPEVQVEHGLRMAQILTAMLTDDMKAPQWMPELLLYNVFGFTNFKTAIDDVIAKKVDLVLYSEVWEFGGNFDGAGFINAEVNRATKAGVLWVNAAGNFEGTTYNSEIKTIKDNWVQLPNQNNALNIRCESPAGRKCALKIVLSWNDFKNDSNLGTDKDLDLALTDDLLNIIQSSALKQSTDPNEARPGFSKYPREIVAAEIDRGSYFIRVKNRSLNFTARDQLRITIDGESVLMPSRSQGNSVLNPADNATLITVGAYDSEKSSLSIGMGKPEILAPSAVLLADGSEYRGSSNSAAIVAAGLALLKSFNPRWQREQLISAVSSRFDWNLRGLSLNLLGFGPARSGPCFAEVSYPNSPNYLQEAFSRGGVAVQTTAGIRVMVPFDPILLNSQLRRIFLNDMIVALPSGGYASYPRRAAIPQGAVEIFQRPLETGLCRSTGSKGKNFQL